MSAALKAFAPFVDLSDVERAEVADLLEERSLSPDETLFAEGDDAESLVLVVDGALAISSARAKEPGQVGAGTVLGGLALFAVGARESSVSAVERTRLLLLRREDFLRLAEDSPRTACRVAMAISAELAVHVRAALGDLPAAFASVDRAERGE